MKNKGRRAKPRGKPFTGKDDPRNGKNGSLTNAAAVYGCTYRNCLARKMPPETLANIVVKAAKAGRVWAIKMLHDDSVGLPKQPLEVIGGLKFEFSNGNNNGENSQ